MEKEMNVLYFPKKKNTMERRFEGSPQTSPVCVGVLSTMGAPVCSGHSRVATLGRRQHSRGC